MDPWKIFAERKLVLVSVGDLETGKENIMPARWCTRCSNEPPLIAISIDLTRYTHELLEKNDYFGIAIPNESFDYSFIGSNSGRNIDKFKEANIERTLGKYGVPLIKEALLSMELKKYGVPLKTGDHTFFIGQVLETICNSQ